MDAERDATRDDDLSSGINHEEGGQQSNIHISDVIAAIQNTDPSFEATVQQIGTEMFSGSNNMAGPSQVSQPQPVASQSRRINAYVKIVEQPASKSLRFRYECEGRSAGSIPGVHSTPENKTYPTIEIVGYKGRAVVVVSCVTKEEPFRAHPHNLVGRDGCRRGVCTVEINSESMCVSFSNLGIQCVKRKDIEEALRVREEIRVDPFKKGFSHRSQPTSIDLNAVRLCFQVFLEGPERGRFTLPLKPVVSDIIYDKKAMSELVICKLSHCTASVAGGREIILLCEKVAKEDISIRFYEQIDGQTVWEGWGDFQHANVHKQVAITFRSPTYRYLEVDQPIKVWIHLKRPSDGAVSEPLPFELLPLDADPLELKRKRQKTAEDQNEYLRRLQPPIRDIANMDPLAQPQLYHNMNVFEIPQTQERIIKTEPSEQVPSPYAAIQGGGASAHYEMHRQVQATPSPQPYGSPSPSPEYGALETWGNTPLMPLQHHPPMNITNAEHAAAISLLDMDNQLNPFTGNSDLLESLLNNNAYQSNAGRMDVEHDNMTDSFTRMTTNVLNELEAAGGGPGPHDVGRPN